MGRFGPSVYDSLEPPGGELVGRNSDEERVNFDTHLSQCAIRRSEVGDAAALSSRISGFISRNLCPCAA